jgi:hypothetical protein
MEDDIPEAPTSRFDICKQGDSDSTDNKYNKPADTNIRTIPNHKRNSPTSRSKDCTTCRIPKYTDVDSNIFHAMDGISNLFRKPRLYQRNTTKDNRSYILRKPLAA